ncbi:MAG: hypothetical protein Q7R70_06040 [Candidatus Diapherotrites archaeon]|nr:hypothetical protein [Candidatus Diapherotrites archaeon]
MESNLKKKEKKTARLIGKRVFSRLSPLQKQIAIELSEGKLCLGELSKKIKHNVFTIGKQLSIMQFRTKYNPLLKKGITKPLVAKQKEESKRTTYSIISNSPPIKVLIILSGLAFFKFFLQPAMEFLF